MNVVGKIKRRVMWTVHSAPIMKRKNNLQFLRLALFYKERQRLANGLNTNGQLNLKISQDSGLLRWDANTLPEGKRAVEECKKIIENDRPIISKLWSDIEHGNLPEHFSTNPFHQPDLKPYLKIDSPLMRFGLHPAILKIVSDYLGMLPILTGINLMYSPNKSSSKISSQLYHLDMHDRKCMKIFIYIDDVDEECGPLTAIPARLSEKIERKLKYKNDYVFHSGALTSRVPDETIEQIVPKDAHVTFTGKAGSALFIDTDRCFHYGSRMATKPRIALQYYYETPFGFGFPPNFDDASLFTLKFLANQSDSEIEKLVLGGVGNGI